MDLLSNRGGAVLQPAVPLRKNPAATCKQCLLHVVGTPVHPFRTAWYQLTGWTLFAAASIGVPDGGVTVMLLGVALGVLALARRFLVR